MEKTYITIIGAGFIGLAIGSVLSKKYSNIIILEKNEKFGQETSSRNSEVIHAGIYYPEKSLKAQLCRDGKGLLYEFLEKHLVPYKKCGKYIVAVQKQDEKALELLKYQAEKNGINDLKWLSPDELPKCLPDIQASKMLFSPSTGIFDTHQYMKKLESICFENNVLINYNSKVVYIEKTSSEYLITIQEQGYNEFQFQTEVVINCAGLQCEKIAQMACIPDISDYKIYWAKGEYFRLPPKYKNIYSSLIYPAVNPNSKSLGIHTVIDMQGMLKLGPNIFYVAEINYNVNESHKEEFYNEIKRYLPFIKQDDLIPDMSGIRPKRQGPEDDFKDFIIQEETHKGYTGFINLIGIDSPGLTSSLAIAQYIKNLI